MRRPTLFALSFLALGALTPFACTQDFSHFEPRLSGSGGSGGAGGSGPTTTTTTATTSTVTSTSTGTGGSGGTPECTDATMCDDANPCTTDTCDKVGTCAHKAIDGAEPMYMDVTPDCQTEMCVGGMKTLVPLDTDVVDDGKFCTDDSCKNGMQIHAPKAANTGCGAMQVCDNSGNCVGCNADGDCASPGACKAATCVNHQCMVGNVAAHQVCMGGVCDGNGACTPCVDSTDCAGTQNGVCLGNMCVDSCGDGVKDGAETDKDCGGGVCATCTTNKDCNGGGDCSSKVCKMGKCQSPSCNDGVLNGSETDLDCGANGNCPKCNDGQMCQNGGNCSSGHCVGNVCKAQCADGAMDGSETDVDCGGSCATKCANGKKCAIGADCTSNDCVGNTCVSQCMDGATNGMETDVDCGGGTCPGCVDGKSCLVAGDCTSTLCLGAPLKCVSLAMACSDSATDGTETDVDCGGMCPLKCVATKSCLVNADCVSAMCVANKCM